MKWSWKLGTIAGIAVYIHWTFLILILWVIVSHYWQNADVGQTTEGVALVLLAFGCILLHELGHALMARRYGIATRDITLLPIGGVAQLERMPDDPWQELWVALAGPAVNVVIAGVLLVLLVVFGSVGMLLHFNPLGQAPALGSLVLRLVVNLATINVALVVFNLLPAFPMDGGRVLRALLATRIDYVQATQIAATIGQGMAFLFGFLGLLSGNPFAVFVALFVYIGAQDEATLVQMRSLLRGLPVKQAMMTRFRTLSPDDPLEVAMSELLAGAQQDFPVVQNEQLVGLLHRQQLLEALNEGRRTGTVGAVMEPNCPTVADSAMLEQTFQQMRQAGQGTLPVLKQGQLVGLVTLENVGELLMILTALQKSQARGEFQNPFRLN